MKPAVGVLYAARAVQPYTCVKPAAPVASEPAVAWTIIPVLMVPAVAWQTALPAIWYQPHWVAVAVEREMPTGPLEAATVSTTTPVTSLMVTHAPWALEATPCM